MRSTKFLAAVLLWTTHTAPGAMMFVTTGGSIQDAIDQAMSGDTIRVGPGSYVENIDFNGKELVLESTAGAANTVIDGGGSGTTVRVSGNAEISGFTITGGRASFGAGMSVGGVGTRIIDNIFTGNVQGGGGYGAAIGGNTASPIIAGNLFSNNSSDSQFLSGAVSFVNGSSPRIENNVFFNNQGRGLNLTLPTGNSPFVTNNTFWGNTAAIRIDARVDTSSMTLQNNILGNNAIGLEVDFHGGREFAAWEHNLLFDNGANYDGISSFTGLDGNIEGDPLVADASTGDFQLQFGSEAIDAGQNAGSPAVDFLGLARPIDGDGDGLALVDIGAFEFVPEPHSTVCLLVAGLVAMAARRRTLRKG